MQSIANNLFSSTWGKVVIDSREVETGDVFIALPGENVHGNQFLSTAIDAGAALVIADAEAKHISHPKVMAVKKPAQYLWNLGKAVRKLSEAKIIAITGSNGKTTTKDMLFEILNPKGHTLKTKGNLNNQLGAPLTLCSLKEEHRYGVVELGTSFPGEIEKLTQLTEPHISVLTSVNPAHLSGLKSLAAIAEEKSNIFSAAPEASVFARVEDLKHRPVKKALKGRDVVFFDVDEERDEPSEAQFRNGSLHWQFHGQDYKVNSPARHNLDNAQAAISIAEQLGIETVDIAKGLNNWSAPAHRMCLINWKKRKVLDDCYNSNPASVRSALETAVALKRGEQQRIFVIMGDMMEMGRQSKALHRKLGAEMANMGIDALFTYGDHSKEALKSYSKEGGGNHQHCQHPNEVAQLIQLFTRPYDIILVKGSRSMRLELVLEALQELKPLARRQSC
jgi:UDP-N-acetylmuramoyl-tripeptide--D-alanyl-D-alanine ligase